MRIKMHVRKLNIFCRGALRLYGWAWIYLFCLPSAEPQPCIVDGPADIQWLVESALDMSLDEIASSIETRQ